MGQSESKSSDAANEEARRASEGGFRNTISSINPFDAGTFTANARETVQFDQTLLPGSSAPTLRGFDAGRPSVKRVTTATHSRKSEYALMILLPHFMFTFVLIICTFAFHRLPMFAYMCALGCLVSSIVMLFLDQHGQTQRYLKLGILCGVATIVGYILGMYNFENYMKNYLVYQESRSNANVLPTEPAAAHADAGKITFTDSTYVDPNRAMGFKVGDVYSKQYCVAPILGDPQQSQVDFWAAGTECCQTGKAFSCNDGKDPRAKSGVVIIESDSWLFPSNLPYYMQAIAAAEGKFKLTSSKPPLFVRWVMDPRKAQEDYWLSGVKLLLISSIVYLCISAMLGWLPMPKRKSPPPEKTTLFSRTSRASRV